MSKDGIALTSARHPVEPHWAKRLWGWLWPRDINPDSLVDVEFSTDDLRYNCEMHYVILRVSPSEIPEGDLIGAPAVWALVDGMPKFWPTPAPNIKILYRPDDGLPYGFRHLLVPS